MFDPLTMGLISGGFGLLNTFMGRSAEKNAVKQRNQQRQQAADTDYFNRLAIRNAQFEEAKEIYGLQIEGYEQGVKNRESMTAMALMQDKLRMNELMKGMKFADQDASIALARSSGKIAAGPQTGRTAARRSALDAASVFRNVAKREERMVGEVFANSMRGEARLKTLDAQNLAAWQQVRFAPRYGPAVQRNPVTMESGPSSMSLISGIGGAALAGFSAYNSQANFQKQLQIGNPGASA